MKPFFAHAFLTSILFISFLPTAQGLEIYQLDPNHTLVVWHINHLGFSNPTGKWMAEGTLALDEAKPQNSKVNAVIKIKEGVTGIPALDQHLYAKDFFEVEKFPTATFASDKVTLTGKNTAKVKGTLTLRGISKPVVLEVTFNKKDNNPINKKLTVGFSATTQLKRSEFGMTAFLPALGDEVKLEIEAEGNKVVTPTEK